MLSDAITRIDGSIVEHDKMAASPMSEDIRKAIYEKICPEGWLTQMRLAGVDISTSAKLKAQMLRAPKASPLQEFQTRLIPGGMRALPAIRPTYRLTA